MSGPYGQGPLVDYGKPFDGIEMPRGSTHYKGFRLVEDGVHCFWSIEAADDRAEVPLELQGNFTGLDFARIAIDRYRGRQAEEKAQEKGA